MDAYDIFKKLTKGLKFNTNIIGAKQIQELPKVSSQSESKVKLELTEDTESTRDTSDSDAELQTSDQEQKNGEEFPLMEGVSTGRKKKKKKKEKPESLKQKLEEEENNRFRNEHGIRAVGRAVPPALSDFASLSARYGVASSLVDTVTRCGYTEPTPVQRQAIPCMLENRQILACAPTGSGKTAAFLVPVLHALGGAAAAGPRALVLCPTRELAQQTHREALRLSAALPVRATVLNKISEAKVKEREATFKKSDIVITTPNRLCYLLNQENVSINLDSVRWLIVDEADKLFEGSAEQESDFRRQMEAVMAACGGRERRVAMFSATHTPAVAKWCRRNLRGLVNLTVGQRNAATSLVQQELLYCGSEAGKLVAFRQLVQQGLKPPVLVFVQSKDRAKQLFKELIYDGINVDVIHADRTQAQRDNVVRSFRIGKIWVLICTELMGRGIDFRGVSLVVNYDFPPSAIAYVHRIGRAGRAGQTGRAITFFTQDDVNNLRSIAAVMKASGCAVPEYTLQLRQNPNVRKRLATKAPRRDDITTVLATNRKRKLEAEKQKEEKKNSKKDLQNNSTTAVKNSKKAKHRKTEGKSANSHKDKDFSKKPKKVKKKLGKNKKVEQKIDKVKNKKK